MTHLLSTRLGTKNLSEGFGEVECGSRFAYGLPLFDMVLMSPWGYARVTLKETLQLGIDTVQDNTAWMAADAPKRNRLEAQDVLTVTWPRVAVSHIL